MLIDLLNKVVFPEKLVRARIYLEHFVKIILSRYLKPFIRVRMLGRFDEVYGKFVVSPTWRKLSKQVFGRYLGQYSFTPASQIRFLVEKLHITSQSHVLDLASGLGGLSCYLAIVSGCSVTGLDASPVAVGISNKESFLKGLAKRVHFEVGVLPCLPYPDCCFDTVVSIDSIYAVPDKNQLFCNCYRVLKPGGHIGFYTLYEKRKIPAKTPIQTRTLRWMPLKPYSVSLQEAHFMNISKVDLTTDLVEILSKWIYIIEKNRDSLEQELGKNTIEEILKDFKPILVSAEDGYIGRAFFEAQKPLFY